VVIGSLEGKISETEKLLHILFGIMWVELFEMFASRIHTLIHLTYKSWKASF
jgi:hypothetical protein